MQKRVLIALIYGFFLVGMGASFYFIFKDKPSCQDGILNQNEERTDCGGPCLPCAERLEVQDLQTEKVEWTKDGETKYDALATVSNPNELLGLENFSFRLNFFNEAGENYYSSPWENGFILPKEKKSLPVLGMEATQAPVKIEVEWDKNSFVWQKFSQYEEPDLFIINPRFEKMAEAGKNQAVGTLVNKSRVDFETIRVKVIIRNLQQQFLGVNYQIINTVRAGEQRDFVVFFPSSGSDLTAKIEVEPETNVFSSENFIRQYGRPEKWDE